MSKKQWLWENRKYISLQWHLNNRCLLTVIFKICDSFWYSYILAYFAANDDKDIFLHLLLRWNHNITIFCMGTRDIRGVRSMDGDSVQMLAWNGKFQAQRVKVSCLTLHSISVWAHCSTQKSKCREKVLVHFYDDHFHWQSCLHEKQRVLEYRVFDVLLGKGTLELSMTLCIQTSTWIRKWIFKEVLCQAFGCWWYSSDIVVQKILRGT